MEIVNSKYEGYVVSSRLRSDISLRKLDAKNYIHFLEGNSKLRFSLSFHDLFVDVNKDLKFPLPTKRITPRKKWLYFVSMYAAIVRRFLLLVGCVATGYRYMFSWASIYRPRQQI